MITAVLLSWNRLQNLNRIVEAFKKYDEITEIIIWNNNPDILSFTCEGAKVISSTSDMGLWTRFSAAALAKNNCILFHDDDLLCSVDIINDLYKSWEAKPKNCHGIFGREVFGGKYVGKDAVGEVPIVLTRCLITNKENCIDTLKYAEKIDALGGKPRGNGEDICLSYVAMRNSGEKNLVIDKKAIDLGSVDEQSIHLRFEAHMEYRSKVCALMEKEK